MPGRNLRPSGNPKAILTVKTKSMVNIYYDEEKEEGIDEVDEELAAFEPEPDGEEESHGATSGVVNDPRYELATKMLRQVHETIGQVLELMKGEDPAASAVKLTELLSAKKQMMGKLEDISGSRVLEGVFDGAAMIGSDGKSYAVPPNYASKSRLVEGDVMKLTIRPDGTFIYKQIGPIERKRVVGCLAFDASSSGHVVVCEELTFKVLPASVSYFRGEPGDEAVILVPKSGKSVWAAVENIIKK